MDKEDSKVLKFPDRKKKILRKCLCLRCFFQWVEIFDQDTDEEKVPCPECGQNESFTTEVPASTVIDMRTDPDQEE